MRDLLAAVPGRHVQAAVDLGCGPGNSTAALRRASRAAIVGLDSSADMVAAARKRLPHLQFSTAGIETWDHPGPFGVILANAVLQWVPDHAAVFPRLLSKLAPEGAWPCRCRTTRMSRPTGRCERSRRMARGPKSSRPSRERRGRGANWYYEMLRPRCTQVDIWRTT